MMRCTLNIKHRITFDPLVYKYCIITEGNVIYEDLEAAMHHYRGIINRHLIISQQSRDKGIIPIVFCSSFICVCMYDTL